MLEMMRELENMLNGSLPRMTSINHNTIQWMPTCSGAEYIGDDLREWVKRRGIVHEVTRA